MDLEKILKTPPCRLRKYTLHKGGGALRDALCVTFPGADTFL